MAVLNFSDALVEARRKAQLTGRPLSQSEMEGIASGYAETAADRAAKQKELQIYQQQADTSAKSETAQESQFTQNLAETQSEYAKTFEENQAEFQAKMEEQKSEFATQSEEWQTQLEETQGEFAKNLELSYEKMAEEKSEFNKTYKLQQEQFAAERQAAERAYSQSQTNMYVGAGVSIASVIILGILLAPAAGSDERLKKNIRPITEELNPMSLLAEDEIRGIFYEWKDERLGTKTEIGFTAQMFEKIPGLVVEIDGVKCLRYDRITALLWEQNRALLKRLEKLEEKANG